MPPYSQPSFEVIEAKSWAAACVDSLFSDTESITFEPEQPVKLPPPPIPKKEDIRPHPPSLLKSRVSAPASTAPRPTHRTRANPLRRSLSVLESSTFITSEHTKTERSNTYRDKRTMTPSASAAHLLVDHHHRSAAQSAPELLPPSRPKRRSWTLDRLAVKQLFTTDSCSQKERDGLAIWKRYFHTFLLDTAPFLPDKTLKSPILTQRSAQLSRFIMTELLSTEETYLDHLTIIRQVFMDPMMEAATAQPRPLANLKDVQTIFAYIPQLIMLSTSLLRRLHSVVREDATRSEIYSGVGKVFCEYLPQLDIYIFYAANYAKAQRCAAKAKRNIISRQLVQEKRMNRLGLADYAIAPIQRITRYCLLLKDLIKHSTPAHPDYPYLERALKCMTALAIAMNNIQ